MARAGEGGLREDDARDGSLARDGGDLVAAGDDGSPGASGDSRLGKGGQESGRETSLILILGDSGGGIGVREKALDVRNN